MGSSPLKLPSGRPGFAPEARSATPLGRPSPGAAGDLGAQEEKGDGTVQSGYAGPEFGPFACSNCVHFHEGDAEHPKGCDHPQVISDDEVQQVQAEGCCNYFRSQSNGGGAAEDETGDEDNEGEGAAAIEGDGQGGEYQ